MSQQYSSTLLFITDLQGANHFQQYNFEVLNYTSLNFARSRKPTDSHTAAMTAERRKLFDQLPRLDTKVVEKPPSRKTNVIPHNDVQNSQYGENAEVTRPVSSVKFVIDHVDDDDAADHNDHSNDVDHIDNRKKKHKFNQKAYRRASAPAQGIDYYFKNAKQSKANSFYFNSIKKKDTLCVPSAHIEVDEPVESVELIEEEEENNDHDVNVVNGVNDNHHTNSTSMSSSIASVSSIAPSLSPCSSSSSIGSSIEILSPEKQSNFSQAFNITTNPVAMKQKQNDLPVEVPYQSGPHSLPEHIASSPYSDVPWSPAAKFLYSFANPGAKQPLPDEEGQQVGEYIIGKVVGRGGFSTVKQAYAIDQHSGSMETVAVKIVKNHVNSDDNDRVQALLEREIAIWRRLRHSNIVRMISVEDNDYATFIFSEYCPGGTLLDYIKKNARGEGAGLDEDEARNIFLEIAEALRFLHNDARLVHKDIKLDNILLDKEDTWKICDFGLTEYQNPANGFNGIIYNSMVGGSIAYCAPEQLRSPIPLKDPSVDVWSLGVVLFAMITGQLPFSDDFEPRLQLKIINGRYDERLLDNSFVSDELKDLLKGMFKTKPDQRLTISQVLEHQWCER